MEHVPPVRRTVAGMNRDRSRSKRPIVYLTWACLLGVLACFIAAHLVHDPSTIGALCAAATVLLAATFYFGMRESSDA